MEEILGDGLHCEEQLKTTLHCDDKEKLRRKLVLLQREYLRTAQRLQRAERSEAVRKHVRSRITRQDHRDRTGPELTSNSCLRPSPLTLNTTAGSASAGPQSQDHTAGPAGSENSKRSQEIRFFLPAEAMTPQTPDPRPSPALRLRSRRSRLRWEQRSAEAGRSSENSEEGPEQSERLEAAATGQTEGGVRTEVVDESEEVCSGTDSECSSLLLTHWNTNTGQEIQDGQEQREKETEFRPEGGKESESPSLLLTCGNPTIHTGGLRHDAVQNGGREEEEGETSRGGRDEKLCEDSSNEDCKQNAAEQTEKVKRHEDTVEVREERRVVVGGGGDVKGLLDSCTLVEGLPFPAEYYVRTTRRMTSSQSQPDLHAVILSQLSAGRPRRSRGHGRGQRRRTAGERPDRHAEADFSSLTAASPSAGPREDSQEAETSAEPTSQSSSGTSDQISSCQVETDTCSPKVAAAARSARGRQRRRGRGRRRPQTPRCSLSSDAHQTSDHPQTTSFLVSSPASLPGADGTNPRLSPEGAGPARDDLQPAASHSASSLPSSGANKAQSTSSSGHQVYPIFVKCSSRTNRPSQKSQGAAGVASLLLPSPPPIRAPLLPLLSPSLGSLIDSLKKFDIMLDFHLPDEQFASLKLHKLRQVAVEAGAEYLASPSYNTRRGIQRYHNPDPATPAQPRLSLTPSITNSPHRTEANQAAAQSAEMENQQADESPAQVLAEESSDREDPTDQPTENLQCQTHKTSTESASVVQDCAADHQDGEKDQDQGSTVYQAGDEGIIQTLSFDHPPLRSPEEPSTGRPAAEACNDGEAPGESPVQRLQSKESPEPTVSPPRPNKDQDKRPLALAVDSQLLMSPPLASGPRPFSTPRTCSSAFPVSPILPSLGLTPLPLNSSPTAPALVLPPPHSPSTRALSPPALSPCPSLPPSQPPTSPVGRIRPFSEPPQTAAPPTRPADSAVQSQASDGTEAAGEHKLRCMHTLKAPAGGCLVDACCLPGSSGGLWVAAAGKWAVCLWSQTSASDWSLTHTWAFNEPVISVFAVPDAAGLICVTLGQLEIREVRMLSCSSLLQVQLCGGVVQAVVGVSRSRVVTSSHSASGSTLQVFSLSDCGSTHSSRPLVAPGVCVGALGPVDGLSDALIGTDEGGCLFIWNLKTGQLLQRILLGDGVSHTACLRGYSSCGVLFVLLQHQLLSSPEEEERASAAADQKVLEEEEVKRKTVLFSLVAVNPLTRKSVRAARLYPPKAWTGRLCEADVSSSSVVGLSQTGCVCVWELGRLGDSGAMVWAPEGEGWQLARWGGGGTLVTGHHDGDVTLHCYSTRRTSLCR